MMHDASADCQAAVMEEGHVAVDEIRILIAHNSAMSSELLVGALNRHGGFHVVGSASFSGLLLEEIKSRGCDVALITAHLQDGPRRGFAVLREIRETFPATRCVMLLERSDR